MLALVLPAAPAAAAPPLSLSQHDHAELVEKEAAANTPRWHLSLEAKGELPLFVGGRVSLESPSGLRLSTGLGTQLPGYFDILNQIMEAGAGYGSLMADHMAEASDVPLTWRVQVGYKPPPLRGFYFDAGYGVMSMAGAVKIDSIAPGIHQGAWQEAVPAQEHSLDSTLHMLTVELGYQWIFGDSVMLRLSLGYIGTVASSTKVGQPLRAYGLSDSASVATEVADQLDELYPKYVHLPAISIGIGYRLNGKPVVTVDYD